jgi:hypothetical protein
MKLSINETKIKSTIGFALAFVVAYGPELVTWIGGLETSPKWLRDIAKGLGVFIGVLTSKNGVAVLNWFTKAPDVIPLLDGSAVVQVRPPTVPGGQSLSHVAVDPTPFATNTAAVVPLASMQTGDVPGKVLPMVADDAPTGNIRPRDKGATTLPGFVVIAFVAALTALLVVFFAGLANAQTPTPPAGGCFSPTLCVGPSASLTVAQFNLATSNFSGGVSPGIGYGLTWTPPTAPWSAVGADIYASTKLGQGVPNQVSFALMFHWLNAYLGIGPSIIQGASGQPVTVQWSIMAGPGIQVQGAQNVYQTAAKAGQP